MKNQANVVIKKGCHSRTSLSGIYNACRCQIKGISLLNRCVEDPRLDPALRPCGTGSSGMTSNFKEEALNKGAFRASLRSGFTLIELLVVVLIVGILAAVAVPQYNRAVWKSRNMQLKMLAQNIWQAENLYFLANDEYAVRFDQLDIDLPLSAPKVSPGPVSPCEISVFSSDAVRQGSDFQIILNAVDSSSLGITALYISGPYKCQGFSLGNTGFFCREKPMEGLEEGDFCKKIEKTGNTIGGGLSWKLYPLP